MSFVFFVMWTLSWSSFEWGNVSNVHTEDRHCKMARKTSRPPFNTSETVFLDTWSYTGSSPIFLHFKKRISPGRISLTKNQFSLIRISTRSVICSAIFKPTEMLNSICQIFTRKNTLWKWLYQIFELRENWLFVEWFWLEWLEWNFIEKNMSKVWLSSSRRVATLSKFWESKSSSVWVDNEWIIW